MITWKKADNPPKTTSGCWSISVVTITNYGNLFELSYFGTKENGCWQRPHNFATGECVEWWIEQPWEK